MKRLLLTILLLSTLHSCVEKKPESLRVGLLVWPPYEFFYLAEQLGFYENSEIEFFDYRTPSEAIRAYENGLIDAIAVTNQLFVKMNEEFQRDKIFQLINYSNGSDLLVSNEKIQSGSDLKGKVVGSEASALGIYALNRFLELYGLTKEQVEYVSTDVANHPFVFKNKKVDAVVTYEPFATEIKKMGGKVICTSKQIPYEISDMLISRPTIIDEKRDQFIELSKGFFRALENYKNNPEKYLGILSLRGKITTEEFSKALEGIIIFDLDDNINLLNKDNEKNYYEIFSKTMYKMIDFKMIKKTIDPYKTIDKSIIEELSEN